MTATRTTATEPGTDERLSILVVDDDPLVRSSLSFMLGGTTDLVIVGEAGDGREAVRLVAHHRPDVVLLDIRMPGMDGLAAAEVLRARADPPEIVVLTTFDTDEHLLRALRAGAAGFLLKDTPPADIIAAIRRVARGEPMLSPGIVRRLIDRATAPERDAQRTRAQARLARLSEREREVAGVVAAGWSNAEIAAELHLSLPTVKAHVSRVLDKLELNNRVQICMIVRDAE
jgi:DNA-binding NarL/FixJ family response regulator